MNMIKAILGSTALTAALAGEASFAETVNVSFEGDHGMLSAAIQYPAGRRSCPMVLLLHGFTSSKDDFVIRGLADELESRLAAFRLQRPRGKRRTL